MVGPRKLKLVAQYNAKTNEYTVLGHNLTEEQATEKVADQAARRLAIFVIDQQHKHRAKQTGKCPDCRGEVERVSHLEPKPRPQTGLRKGTKEERAKKPMATGSPPRTDHARKPA